MTHLTAHDPQAAVGKKETHDPCRALYKVALPEGMWSRMLAPAHAGHLGMLRTLIREASAEGSMTAGLAGDNAQAVEFFAKLKRALVHGYFVEEDPQSGRVESVAVPGYVFWP